MVNRKSDVNVVHGLPIHPSILASLEETGLAVVFPGKNVNIFPISMIELVNHQTSLHSSLDGLKTIRCDLSCQESIYFCAGWSSRAVHACYKYLPVLLRATTVHCIQSKYGQKKFRQSSKPTDYQVEYFIKIHNNYNFIHLTTIMYSKSSTQKI